MIDQVKRIQRLSFQKRAIQTQNQGQEDLRSPVSCPIYLTTTMMAPNTLVSNKPQTALPTTSSPKTIPAKRRRRTTTTGAADDCFACRDGNTPCDRRRPYCSQCIQIGKTCSGYKTTLTWGVGVASRGKLRGLSLPVAKQQKTNTSNTSRKKELHRAQVSSSKNHQAPPISSPTRPNSFNFVPVDPTLQPQRSDSSHQPQYHWPSQPVSLDPSNYRENSSLEKRHNRGPSLQPISVPPPMVSYTLSPTPMTANPLPYTSFEPFVSSPHTPGYDSPSEMPSIQKYFPNPHTWTGAFAAHYYSQPSVPYALSPALTTVSAGMSNATLDLDGFDTCASFFDSDDIEELGRFDSDMSIRALYGIPNVQVGSTKFLRELINYFDHVISPVIVAFDGPRNPYRSHILPLATESPALQHAIAALSASNLRIRHDHEEACNAKRLALTDSDCNDLHDASVRKSSIAHSILRDTIGEPGQTAPGKSSLREIYHKGESIRALNANLRDPKKRDDDSVLATLLILCLYHICDTGVAKFKTQFAGVKRILALRSKRLTTPESRWLITMFRWFDAMAATVNDREGQFDEETTQEDSLSAGEWTLENLAGCDSRLFSIISRLGRLNLLSQGKAVRGTVPQRALPVRNDGNNGKSYHNFDGNGWAKLDLTEHHLDIIRTQFWTEFSSTRQELSDWRFDSTTIPVSMSPHDESQVKSNILDLQNISEAFRFAALLYTERLAHPQAPASGTNFQALVSSAILYIDAVKSDVYLLWPLFITGAECVLQEHRDLIRKRCLSIQGDSGFFNNTSTLRILEAVWKDNDHGNGNGSENVHRDAYSLPSTGSSGGALRWRKAMIHTAMGGEYIVV